MEARLATTPVGQLVPHSDNALILSDDGEHSLWLEGDLRPTHALLTHVLLTHIIEDLNV